MAKASKDVNITVIGASNVGKSQLIQSWLGQTYTPSSPNHRSCQNFSKKRLVTAGTDTYRCAFQEVSATRLLEECAEESVPPFYLQNAHLIIFCYDATMTTAENERLLSTYKQAVARILERQNKTTPICVIGTKADNVAHEVLNDKYDGFQQFCNQHSLKFLGSTSGKIGFRTEQTLQNMASILSNPNKEYKPKSPPHHKVTAVGAFLAVTGLVGMLVGLSGLAILALEASLILTALLITGLAGATIASAIAVFGVGLHATVSACLTPSTSVKLPHAKMS